MLARVEEIPVEALTQSVPWTWESTSEYIDHIDGSLTINTGYMVGHSALRAFVMGADATERPATQTEIGQMCGLLGEGLHAGGLGLSSSHSVTHVDGEDTPVPSRHAGRDEFVALASECGRHAGTSLEIIVGPPGPFEPAKSQLMIGMSLAANRPLNWNVMFPSAANLDVCLGNLELSQRAAREGARIVGLAMATMPDRPFRFRNLEAIPGLVSVLSLSDDDLVAYLADTSGRATFETATKSAHPYQHRMVNFAEYKILATTGEANRRHEGRTVGDIARDVASSPFDVLCDIVIADRFRTVLTYNGQDVGSEDWAALVKVAQSDAALIGGSDAGAHLGKIAFFNYPTRLLEHTVRREGLLPLEEAVALLTSRPAELYGLKNRGTIRIGAAADLVVFDPENIGAQPIEFVEDLPGGASRLVGGADGIDHVFVAGVEIVGQGAFTESRPGRVLRSGRDTESPSMQLTRGAEVHR
jgi:N-acyl-D-aspartate/D-glutamate deacylase